MLDGMGDDIVAAARAGRQFGEHLEHQNEMLRWQNYIAQLESKVGILQQERDASIMHLVVRTRQVEELAQENDKLAEALGVASNELSIRDAELAATKERHAEYTQHLQKNLSQLERAFKSTSGKLAGIEAVYQMTVREIQAITDPSKFSSLQLQNRMDEYKRAWKDFAATGELEYKADVLFSKTSL